MTEIHVRAPIQSLALRWSGRGVTANLLDPGMVKSGLGENFEGPAVLGFTMSRLVPFFAADDAKRACEQYVRLATDPTLSNVSGAYFVSGKEKPDGSSRLSRDPALQQRIVDAAEAWAAPFLPSNLASGGPAIPHNSDNAAIAAAVAQGGRHLDGAFRARGRRSAL